MLEGKCPQCGRIYRGWALLEGSQRICPECGSVLEITNDTIGSADSSTPADDGDPMVNSP